MPRLLLIELRATNVLKCSLPPITRNLHGKGKCKCVGENEMANVKHLVPSAETLADGDTETQMLIPYSVSNESNCCAEGGERSRQERFDRDHL